MLLEVAGHLHDAQKDEHNRDAGHPDEFEHVSIHRLWELSVFHCDAAVKITILRATQTAWLAAMLLFNARKSCNINNQFDYPKSPIISHGRLSADKWRWLWPN
ncbi:hypothetical protein [Parasphingorhabdus sp.]|uniref:hypothetical protein n=1 Tax=Parasphingorhabdus sp. TaxID=2709688 RepID=UPI003D2BD94B